MQDYTSIQNNEPNTQEGISNFIYDALRKVSWPYIIWLALTLLATTAVHKIAPGNNLGHIQGWLVIYYFLIIVHFIARYRKCGASFLLAPDVFFILPYTIFHLGYVTFYGIGLLDYQTGIFYFDQSIGKSIYLIVLGLISFLIGYEIMGPKRPAIEPDYISIPNQSWCFIGQTFMISALAMHLVCLSLIGIDNLKQYGHTAIINIADYTPWFVALVFSKTGFLMIFGLTTYCIASALRYKKLFASPIGVAVISIYLFVLFLEVARGMIFQLFVPMLLIRQYMVKPFRIRNILLIFAGIVVLFTIMGIMKSIVFDPVKMIEEVVYHKESGKITWLDPFVEAGGSFVIVNITANEVPSNQPYWLGESWKNAILHTIPFVQGYMLTKGYIHGVPGFWVSYNYFGLEKAAKGFSVVAEGFLNFGYTGVFVEMAFLGIFIRWLTIKFAKKPSAKWGFIMLGCICSTIPVIRNDINIVTAMWVQIAVVGYLLNLFLSNNEPDYQTPEAMDENTEEAHVQ